MKIKQKTSYKIFVMSVFKELGVIVDSHLKICFIKQSESQQNKHTLAFKGELITLVDSHKHTEFYIFTDL